MSWKRQHNYLTLVTDHARKKIIWDKAGKNTWGRIVNPAPDAS